MPPADHNFSSMPPQPGPFATTHWSLVLAASHGSRPDARAALATLCETYWYPLYGHVRRHGYDPDEAQDLTQEFFATLLEKEYLRAADPHRGRFRSFLLASMNHFLANQRRQQSARKRGGGRPVLCLDFQSGESRFSREPSHDLTAEKAYERRWAMTLIDQALSKLRQEYVAGGKAALFDRLAAFLGGDKDAPYREVASDLGMTEGAVKVAVHRLRHRCRECLRAEVAHTVENPQDVDGELQDLMAIFGR